MRAEKEMREPQKRDISSESEQDDTISTTEEGEGDGGGVVEEGGEREGVEECGEVEEEKGTVRAKGQRSQGVIEASGSLECATVSGPSVFVQLQRPADVQVCCVEWLCTRSPD